MAALGPLWTRPCSGTRPEGASEAKSAPPPKKSKKPHSFCFLRPNRGKVSIDSALKRHIRPAHLPSQSPRQTAPPGLATHPPANRSLDFKVHQPQRPKIAIQRLKTKTKKSTQRDKATERQRETRRHRDKEKQDTKRAREKKRQSEKQRERQRENKRARAEPQNSRFSNLSYLVTL